MAEIQDLNATDASNTGRWPENMPFSGVNDAGRADEGILARWYKDTNASIIASGSSNAFAITSNRVITSLFDGLLMAFTANFSITGATTLNLNGIAAKGLKRFNGSDLASGDIISGQPVLALYKVGSDTWYMLSAIASLTTGVQSVDFTEIAVPAAPAVNTARLFSFDDGAGNTVLGWADNGGVISYMRQATQAEMEAAISFDTRFVSPAKQKYHPTHPKAWGSVSAAGALVASFGVSGAVKNSTGHYTVTLSPVMSTTTDWIVVGSVVGTGSTFSFAYQLTGAGTFTVETTSSGSFSDRAFSFAVYGDQ